MEKTIIIQLILWLGVLAAWISFVTYGIKWLESAIDKLLDRRFNPIVENEDGSTTGGNWISKPARPCYPSYLDNESTRQELYIQDRFDLDGSTR